MEQADPFKKKKKKKSSKCNNFSVVTSQTELVCSSAPKSATAFFCFFFKYRTHDLKFTLVINQ